MNLEETSQNPRILMLVPSMGSGGAERVIATLANELTKKSYTVVILTLTSSESFYELAPEVKIDGANFSVNRNNKISEFFGLVVNGLRGMLFINRYIKKWQPDIVLSFLTHTNILALILRIFDRKLPLIISERAEPRERNLAFRVITKYLYPKADCLVCQSKKVTEFFPKKGREKIKIIPNPLTLESIVLAKPKKRRKAIVGVGRLFPQKNYSLLIKSFNEIKDEFPNHVLEIYGDGYLKNDLQKEINQFELSDRIFLMGVKKDVMHYIYDAQLFVMSSNFEGFPNALIEAMASGLPVVSTDFSTGVARELINDDNGIVVPIQDKEAMSNAMLNILSDSDLQKKMSNKNREIIKTLSTEKVVNMWIQVFDEVRS